jgi:Copper type II ascorbate-dependent monooxygenase, C-terminal domain
MNRSAIVSGLALVSVVALSLGVAGCSGASTGGDGTGINGNTNPGTSSGGSNSTSSGGQNSSGSSGSSSTSGSSSGTASSSGNTSSGSGGDASTGSTSSSSGGGDGGTAMPSHGCGQGTSCTPGSDLAAPDAADGFQFVLKSGQVTIPPNTEAYYCYYKTIPGNASIQVGGFQSWMSTGSSHHFITYQATSGGMADGALQQCAGVAGKWVYATSVAGQVIELKMPDSVGLNMNAGTQLIMNMHFVNPSTTAASPVVKLNVLYAKNVQYQAATMISFNAGIDVPAASALGPGTQTVSGTCTAPVGSKFFALTSHTHKHATDTKVNFVSGGQTQNIVNTTDWESPDVGLFYAPNFLTVNAGDSFTYSCAYSNTTSSPVLVGETAASNEMCMAIGYYFPAGSASCN